MCLVPVSVAGQNHIAVHYGRSKTTAQPSQGDEPLQFTLHSMQLLLPSNAAAAYSGAVAAAYMPEVQS